jgi:hypothetical protein
LMDGTPAGSQAGWVLLASAALIAVFGPLTMRLYRAGLRGGAVQRSLGSAPPHTRPGYPEGATSMIVGRRWSSCHR